MAFAPVFQPSFNDPFDKRALRRRNFFTASYAGSRNNYAGTVGFSFTTSVALTVVALGRSISIAITTNHWVGLWESDGTAIGTVKVTQTSPQDHLGYAYELLSTPVLLSASTTYIIGSDEASGGDLWRDLGLLSSHWPIATINGGRYGDGWGFPANNYGDPNYGYVPVTFFFTG